MLVEPFPELVSVWVVGTVTSTTTVTLGKLDFFTTQEDSYYNVVNLQDLIHGCLLMGGKIYSDVVYFSYMGHNTTYKIGSKFTMLGKSDAKYTTEVGIAMTSDVVSQPEVSLQDSGNPMTVTINNALNTKNIEA